MYYSNDIRIISYYVFCMYVCYYCIVVHAQTIAATVMLTTRGSTAPQRPLIEAKVQAPLGGHNSIYSDPPLR